MQQQKKVINYQVLLEILCCIVFAVLMDQLIVSGKYQTYVTPKMVPYFYFAEIVVFVWAEAGIFRLFKPQYKFRLFHCYILIIPILLLIFPSAPVSSSDLVSRYGVEAFVLRDSLHNHDHDDHEGHIEITGLDKANKTIAIKDEEWSEWIHELSVCGEEYIGYEVIVKGFVFKTANDIKDDEFIVCRLQMSCCAADLAPMGIIAKYDNAKDLIEDQWVEVKGVLDVREDKGLYLNVEDVLPAERPADEYIYPI